MPANLVPPVQDLIRLLPEITLTLLGTFLMVLEPLLRRKKVLGWLALAGLLLALAATAVAHAFPGGAFHSMIVVDGFATFFRVLVIGVGIFTVLASVNYIERERPASGEYYALLVFCVVGQCLMADAADLIVLFIGLEISSISSYVLAGYIRTDWRNNEASVKYFLLGSFASAFLLYGVAWIYGATGSTQLFQIREAMVSPDQEVSLLLVGTAAALIFVGLAFKVAAAPFQIWAADVYQGAPAPVSAFLSAGPKAAAFAAMLRIYMTAFEPVASTWEPIVWVIALATMTIGNFGAILQDNIKRLLGYSSVAHAGYVMVAVAAQSAIGVSAAMFYLAAYAFMNIGAFTVVTHFARAGERYLRVDDLAGLGRRQPVTAALFSLFLLSLIGVPLTGGFFGKFYIFKAALESGLVSLTILGLLNSVVAAYYYLRILVVMYFREPAADTEELAPVAAPLRVVLWGSALGTIFLGVIPTVVLHFTNQAALLPYGR